MQSAGQLVSKFRPYLFLLLKHNGKALQIVRGFKIFIQMYQIGKYSEAFLKSKEMIFDCGDKNDCRSVQNELLQ